jgi:hypothetical protein
MTGRSAIRSVRRRHQSRAWRGGSDAGLEHDRSSVGDALAEFPLSVIVRPFGLKPRIALTWQELGDDLGFRSLADADGTPPNSRRCKGPARQERRWRGEPTTAPLPGRRRERTESSKSSAPRERSPNSQNGTVLRASSAFFDAVTPAVASIVVRLFSVAVIKAVGARGRHQKGAL